jgi:hypothetical protein
MQNQSEKKRFKIIYEYNGMKRSRVIISDSIINASIIFLSKYIPENEIVIKECYEI